MTRFLHHYSCCWTCLLLVLHGKVVGTFVVVPSVRFPFPVGRSDGGSGVAGISDGLHDDGSGGTKQRVCSFPFFKRGRLLKPFEHFRGRPLIKKGIFLLPSYHPEQEQSSKPIQMSLFMNKKIMMEDNVMNFTIQQEQAFFKRVMERISLSDIRMIVFDKDGTLGADSGTLSKWVSFMTNQLLQEVERKTTTTTSSLSTISQTFHDTIGWNATTDSCNPGSILAAGTWSQVTDLLASTLGSYGLSPKLAYQWHASVGQHLHQGDKPIIDNLPELLRTCQEEFGWIVAICTSDDRMSTNVAMQNWNIESYISYSICGNEVLSPKPSSVPLQVLTQMANVAPSQCIVVGDTSGDTGMATNGSAAMCIGVTSGSCTARELYDTGATIVLPNVGYIPTLIREWKRLVQQKVDCNTTTNILTAINGSDIGSSENRTTPRISVVTG